MMAAGVPQSPLQDWSTPLVTATDLSLQPCWGCKGSAAAAWLQVQEVPVPETPNTWSANVMVTTFRLGRNEFLLAGQGATIENLRQCSLPAGVYPVWRDGAALQLQGGGVPTLLRQICSVDFAACVLDTHPVLLTSMIGVSVIAVPGPHLHTLRLWFDRSYGYYFQETLRALAEELQP